MNFEAIRQEKFKIKRENIIPLSELPKKISPKLRSLGWPLECQGSGRTLEDGHNFQVRYPDGDIFYSWNVIIHELGHLRQEDFNLDINKQTDEAAENIVREKDAFVRGWDRLQKYRPDILERLESEFKIYKQKGMLPDFNSFLELYNDFNKNNIIIYNTLKPEDNANIIYNKLKSINISDFFSKIEANKVGEKINVDEANEIIFDIAGQITKEV
ncbi:MAG: hypothetical protein PHG95_02030 [Patescibacteria group bacterium]|nr:hypothetical protein [Patescibacteria group bacterium]